MAEAAETLIGRLAIFADPDSTRILGEPAVEEPPAGRRHARHHDRGARAGRSLATTASSASASRRSATSSRRPRPSCRRSRTSARRASKRSRRTSPRTASACADDEATKGHDVRHRNQGPKLNRTSVAPQGDGREPRHRSAHARPHPDHGPQGRPGARRRRAGDHPRQGEHPARAAPGDLPPAQQGGHLPSVRRHRPGLQRRAGRLHAGAEARPAPGRRGADGAAELSREVDLPPA